MVTGEVYDVLELSKQPDEPPVVNQLDLLLERARSGDEQVVPELRNWLESRPDLWHFYGDLGRHARQGWLGLVAGKDLAIRESVDRVMLELERELAGPNPSRIERLLIDRVLANWLRLHFAELAATQAMNRPKLAEFWDRRQSRAERAYLASLGALTTLRRLLSMVPVPAVTTAQRQDSNSTLEGPMVDPTHSGPPLRFVDCGGA